MTFSILEIIIYFGGLMGIILSIVSFFASKKSQPIKYSLSALLLVTSLIILFGSLNFSGKTIHFIHLFRLDSPIHYLLGPVIYFYSLIILNPNFKYRNIHLLHLIPFALNFIEFLPFYLSSAEIKLTTYKKLINEGSVIMPFHYLLKTILFSSYFIAQFFLIKKYQLAKLIKNKNNSYLIYWFVIFMSSQFILVIVGVSDQVMGQNFFSDPYMFSTTMISFFLFSVVIGLLFFPELLYGTLNRETVTKEKYSFSKLTEAEKNQILYKLYEYINQKDKPYLNEKISLAEVSKLLEIGSQQLSQVINEKTNQNFNDFINYYRIEESKRLLTSPSYSKLTIDAIAQKAGFNSKSAFYTAFKKHTGMTPKEFISSNSKDLLDPSV